MFCDCGGLIINDSGCASCSDCGKVSEKELNLSTKQNSKSKILTEGKSKNPVMRITCPKCGHEECEYWIKQTRASDEPPTRFYRCVKCGHTWREYA